MPSDADVRDSSRLAEQGARAAQQSTSLPRAMSALFICYTSFESEMIRVEV